MENKPLKAAILAAGAGKRMRADGSALPKVMREAYGVPLLGYVLRALDFIPPADTLLIVGYQWETVCAAFPDYPFALQAEQLGTGHAARIAMEALPEFEGDLLICCGDMPLMRRETYWALAETHRESGNACTLLSGTTPFSLPNYGRVLRNAEGVFDRIIEARDASERELAIPELNAGVYLFDARALRGALGSLRRNNAQAEYYLTDAPALIQAQGGKVGVCRRELGSELLGVNTPEQLLAVERALEKSN